ncbi:hypothetical protein BJ508DRAFT_34658 [Ascobolus immersus RN42]|uniref:Uncharacterized protein n=1 Tax=Ascobolus immersus RN42 TaxID=1160509 RepID=A0A3N4HL02_ASCIM|nr:hypothetical protein BJ508DRAFT_34658 [Ascobolus immersus RN42]
MFEKITSPPSETSFVRLDVTPQSFNSILLHAYIPSCTVVLAKDQLSYLDCFESIAKDTGRERYGSLRVEGGFDDADTEETKEGEEVVETKEQETEVEVKGVSVWITSDAITLFHNTPKAGLRIPLNHLDLHALQNSTRAIYLQISLPSAANANICSTTSDTSSISSQVDPLEITLIPDSTGSAEGEDLVTGEAKALEAYDGLSTAMTWLEDAEEDDEDGEDGYEIEGGGEFAGDWIWEGNVDDVGRFEDVEIPAEKLGDGAGVVRPREEDDHEGADGEMKWRKTG